MRYRILSLRCHCGHPSSRIREIGFTSDHKLVVHWRCSQCKSYVYGLKPLDDCFLFCPTDEELAEATVKGSKPSKTVKASFQKKDADFLHSLGVKLPDDGQA